jgi:hypothetical protein
MERTDDINSAIYREVMLFLLKLAKRYADRTAARQKEVSAVEIRKNISRLLDSGVDAVNRIRTSMADRRHKKQALQKQLILMSGSIKRVK